MTSWVMQVLGKKDVHVGVQDTVSTSQFAQIWSSLGLRISSGYVDAIFNKYGHNSHGRMPIMVRIEGVIVCLSLQDARWTCL